MTAAEAIASLPDDTLVSVVVGAGSITVGELRAALTSSGPIYLTTREASRKYSRSPEWWAGQAKSMPGAMKDSRWRLPVSECEALLDKLAKPRTRRRGPWNPQRQGQGPLPRG